ncbi:MAG: hypothetical protein ABSD10_00690 [Candidatus Saccharimonadales bacterium]|jgi:hypothetical protein
MAHKGKIRTRLSIDGKAVFAIRERFGKFANLKSVGKSAHRDRVARAWRKVRSSQDWRSDQDQKPK